MELEKDLKRLEEIANQLESGKNFDKSFDLYEEGIKLSKKCLTSLDEAEGKLKEIKDGKEVSIKIKNTSNEEEKE
ncbi:MAG: exodeoxyribonuclease VII small subunit [Clostridia bacterium]|nr:exodeoxyribonuclease VII small subunit [Clostridia bacterium]